MVITFLSRNLTAVSLGGQESDGISPTAIREIMLLKEIKHEHIVRLDSVHLNRQVLPLGASFDHERVCIPAWHQRTGISSIDAGTKQNCASPCSISVDILLKQGSQTVSTYITSHKLHHRTHAYRWCLNQHFPDFSTGPVPVAGV